MTNAYVMEIIPFTLAELEEMKKLKFGELWYSDGKIKCVPADSVVENRARYRAIMPHLTKIKSADYQETCVAKVRYHLITTDEGFIKAMSKFAPSADKYYNITRHAGKEVFWHRDEWELESIYQLENLPLRRTYLIPKLAAGSKLLYIYGE